MPSTYSTNLKLELIANGEQSGTWGVTTNTNLGTLIEEAICGVGTVSIPDANTTISIANGASSTARKVILTLTGTLTAARNLVVPTINKQYIVYNNTSGGYAVTVKTSAGTGIAVPAGQKRMLYVDSTNVNEAIDSFGNINVNGNISATGNATVTGSITAGSVSVGGSSLTLNNNTTLTTTGVTNVTLPQTGTLATLAGTETLTNKTLTSPTVNGGTISNAGLTSAVLTTSTLNVAPTAGDSSLAIACTSFIQQALAALVPTGSVISYAGSTAPSGWVMMDGLTIGSATSGATGRASPDTESLFLLLWNSFNDTNAPVSGGRGASAAADWAANKRITLPNSKGRVIAGVDAAGTTLAIATVLGNTGGAQTHTLTTSEMPVHSHGVNDPSHTHGGVGYSQQGVQGSLMQTMMEPYNSTVAAAYTGISIQNQGGGGAHNNVQPTLAMNYIIKL